MCVPHSFIQHMQSMLYSPLYIVSHHAPIVLHTVANVMMTATTCVQCLRYLLVCELIMGALKYIEIMFRLFKCCCRLLHVRWMYEEIYAIFHVFSDEKSWFEFKISKIH